ncbi:MAG: terminase small subunit [Janthinobacterium sp.]|jgi:hypothetical protein
MSNGKPPRIYHATGTPLTIKQTKFIKEVIKSGNAIQAVKRVYDVKNDNTARAIAHDNLDKSYIKKSIQEHLQDAGYNPADSIALLQKNERSGVGVKATASDSIRASELLLKLAGMVVDRSSHLNVNMDVSTLTKDKLIDYKDKFDNLLDE